MIIKRYLLKFTVFFIALFSFLILCEIGIRNLYPKYDPSGRIKFEYNKDFNIRIGKKNYSGRQIKNTGDYDTSVTFNKYGFRDDKDVTQINPQDLLVVRDSYSLGWGVENEVHINFTGLLRENKIDFIDLRKSFEAGGNPLNYHFENDGHWNENGHYLSAKGIYDYLKLNCIKSGGKHCLN